ncbi:polyprenyl synthetase family protein [Georgenia thermotolerans]|nr:polyprenyl synthetase family protein [Georgenia thermotolerans]
MAPPTPAPAVARGAGSTIARERVRAVLADVLAEARAEAAGTGDEDYRLVWDELARTALGGKGFRGTLVVRTHDALGGREPDAADRVGAALELVHTAFLVHDDLIDRDFRRRGAPNLMGTVLAAATARGLPPAAATRLAEAAAVLAGDLALGLAHRLVALAAPAAAHSALQDLLSRTLAVSVRGELADVRDGLPGSTPTVDGALETAAAKTAMYSFRAPLAAGALLVGAPAETRARLDEAGRRLGVAFQLVDDLCGVFAPDEVTGKSRLSDLREGTATVLMLLARQTPRWQRIDTYLRRELTDEAAAGVRGELAASGAPQQVAGLVRAELDAVGALVPDLPPAAARLLGELTATVSAAVEEAERHVRAAG